MNLHPCFLIRDGRGRPAELHFFQSLTKQADAGTFKPNCFEQGARTVSEDVECALVRGVLLIGLNEALQKEHPQTHIHGLLVEDGDGVMRECKHIPSLYSPRLQGFCLRAYEESEVQAVHTQISAQCSARPLTQHFECRGSSSGYTVHGETAGVIGLLPARYSTGP